MIGRQSLLVQWPTALAWAVAWRIFLETRAAEDEPPAGRVHFLAGRKRTAEGS